MEKKEVYRHILPHYQQPGQAYFVTFCLWNAVAHNALSHYTHPLHELRLQIGLPGGAAVCDRILLMKKMKMRFWKAQLPL